VRGLVLGALKGDMRSLGTLFRLAEQTGQFEEPSTDITLIKRIIVTGVPRDGDDIPAITDISREQP
jgi:hypothetical protein